MKKLIFILVFLAGPAFAVLPSEVLDDPVLEARARALSQELKCVVCQGENIDESNAGIAHDLRILVRERLTDGASDQDVLDFIVSRYGEYVLMRPTFKGGNIALYLAGPVMLLLGFILAFVYLRTRTSGQIASGVELSDDENQRLQEILKE